MTDLLTPVGSGEWLEALFVEIPAQITADDVIGNVAGRFGEVSTLPEKRWVQLRLRICSNS